MATISGNPLGLAVDASGNLFAADYSGGTITEFSLLTGGAYGVGQNFATGLSRPNGLAFDAHGDLFAANSAGNVSGQGSITEFAFDSVAGTFAAGKTVETGLSGPSDVAFSPIAPPAVPEASTTVSLGLLLALGVGGLAVARKRRKA